MKNKFFALLIGLTVTFGTGHIALAQGSVVLQQGSAIQIRLNEALSSEVNHSGDVFEATLDEELAAQGFLLAPTGSLVLGELTQVEDSGDVQGRAKMELTLRELVVNNTRYSLNTSKIRLEAEGDKEGDAKIIGGSAGAGALLGAILGGTKGAIIGAAIGAGAGTTAVLVTDGKDIEFEPEQRFQFMLDEPLRLRALSSDDGSRAPRLDDRNLEERARELREAAVHVKNQAEKELRQDALDRQRASSSFDFDQRAQLYFMLSNFSNSAQLFAQVSQSRNQASLQGALTSLTEQARAIEQMFARLAADDQLENHWRNARAALQNLDRVLAQIDFRGDGGAGFGGEGRLRWSGVVDGEDQILFQKDRVWIQHVEGERVFNQSSTFTAALPQEQVRIELSKLDGRGEVRLLETPSRWNNYTAVVLIEDTQRGSDRYEFELSWRAEQ